ncbi:hypothetical protein BpHYR1_036884 [Brachionus plicatilis]|uniref:Uncharacterized protein n=1 Tax=Brachionus plicatilis TaxID=10195 RepID=A0A3M7QST5_BRAPC|nr:hypothetical protein BpHYR1_036884 [Brachionus plicatilis]
MSLFFTCLISLVLETTASSLLSIRSILKSYFDLTVLFGAGTTATLPALSIFGSIFMKMSFRILVDKFQQARKDKSYLCWLIRIELKFLFILNCIIVGTG